MLDDSSRRPRGLEAHSAPVLLLEAVLRLPALTEVEQGKEEAPLVLAVAQLVDRFFHAARVLGGVPLGIADLHLLVCWPAAEEGLADGTRRALRLARSLASDIRQLSEIRGVRAEFRQCVSVGTACFGRFGGLAGSWPHLLSGTVADLLRPAWVSSRVGELVLPLDAWAALGMDAVHESRRDGLVAVDIGGEGLASLDDVALQELEPRPASLLALAPCAVAALEVCGLDPASSHHGRRLHAVTRNLQRAVRSNRGALVELRHDHRGLVGIVAFDADAGHSTRAALRALRFGQDFGHGLADQGLEVPVGVASGAAWLWRGADGEGTALLGPTVDRALALIGAGASELVCDAATARLTRRRAQFEDLGPGAPRGLGGQRSYAVEQVEQSTAKSWRGASGLIGRQAQLAQLDQVVGEFLAGSTVVLMVEGEEGVGKSRIVDEAVARLRSESVQILTGYGVPGASAAPLTPWRGALLQLLELSEPTEPETCRDALLDRIARVPSAGYQPDLDVLGAVLPLPSAAAPRPAPVSTGLLLEELQRLILVLRGGGPLVVVLEDGQWLDSASWSLARELAAHHDDLLVVVALRGEVAETELEVHRLAALPETTVMVLRGLSAQDIPGLLAQELGLRGFAPELIAWLHGTTKGNPRVCLEWIKLLIEEGTLEATDGEIMLSPTPAELAGSGLSGLASLLVRRIRSLPPSTCRTLAVAALAGGVFQTRLLLSVHPDQPAHERVVTQLEALAAAGLIQPAPGRADAAWTVTHAVVARVAREFLEPEELRQLHGRIADWYEADGGELAPLYPMMASHWLAAGVQRKGLDYLELSGDQAMRAGAISEAARHFQQALRVVSGEGGDALEIGPLRRARWERNLGDARFACGELERCATHFERSLGLLGHSMPGSRVLLALHFVAQLGLQLLHRLVPQRWYLASEAQHGRLLEASLAAERLAERHYYSADLLALGTSSVLSANLADRIGEQGRNARPYASMSVLAGLAGLAGLSSRLYERAVSIGIQAPDPPGLSVALFTRSAHFAGIGQWDRAGQLAERAVREAQVAAAWQEEGVARTMRAMCLYYRGRYGPAEACYGELLGLARERYNAQHEAWALYGGGECQLQTGRLHEAARSVQQGLAVLRNLEDHPSRLICHGLLAAILCRQGRLDRAREAADLAWSHVQRVPVPFVISTLDGYSGLAESCLALWERERDSGVEGSAIRRRAQRAVALLGRYSRVFAIGRPRHLLAKAELARLASRPAASQRALEGALTSARDLGMPLELARAQAALSVCELVEVGRRGQLRSDAEAAFSALGCGWHARQLRHGDGQQGQSQ